MRRRTAFWAFVASLAGWTAIWYLITAFEIVNSEFLTPPGEIVEVFWELLWEGYAGATLTDHFLISLYRTLFGFFAAILTAVPLGLRINCLEPWEVPQRRIRIADAGTRPRQDRLAVSA